MYIVIFLKGRKTVLEKGFLTQKEAEDFVSEYVPDYPYEYQIYDKDNDILIDEGELDYDGDIESGSMDNLFPDEESKEGFDVDDFFEKD